MLCRSRRGQVTLFEILSGCDSPYGVKNWAGNMTYSTDRVLSAAHDRRGARDGRARRTCSGRSGRATRSVALPTPAGVLLSTEHLDRGRRGRDADASSWKQASATANSGARLPGTGWPSRTMRVAAAHLRRRSDRDRDARIRRPQPVARRLGRGARARLGRRLARAASPARTRTSTEQSSRSARSGSSYA